MADITFSVHNETITLNTTINLVNKVSLFETQVAAVVTPLKPVTNAQIISSDSKNDTTCFNVGSTVYVFNVDCSELSSSITTDTEVDSLALSARGDFLLVAERSGYLNVIYVPKEIIIHRQGFEVKNSNQQERSFSSVTFVPSNISAGKEDIIIAMLNGVVYQVTGIDLDSIRTAILEKDTTMGQQIKEKLQLRIVCGGDGGTLLGSSITKDSEGNLQMVTLTNDENVLKVVSLLDGEVFATMNKNQFNGLYLKKISVIGNNRFYLVLDKNGLLHLICPRTMSVIKSWSDWKVYDFIVDCSPNNVDENVYEDELTSSSGRIVLVLNRDDVSLGRRVEFCDLTYFTTEVTHTVKTTSDFVAVVPSADRETVVVLDGVSETNDENNDRKDGGRVYKKVSIKTVTEVTIEKRILKLLEKNKIQEAEDMAKEHDVDLQEIYQSRLRNLLNKMAGFTEVEVECHTGFNETTELFRTYAAKIRNATFVLDSFLQVQLPSLDSTREVLMFIKTLLMTDQASKNDIMKVNIILRKLRCFDRVFGEHDFKNSWIRFSRSNACDVFVRLSKAGDARRAFELWTCLQEEIVPHLYMDRVQGILDSLPSSPDTSRVVGNFLEKHFLPVVLKRFPDLLNVVASWFITRINEMELVFKVFNPTICLEFVNILPKVIKGVDNSWRGVISSVTSCEDPNDTLKKIMRPVTRSTTSEYDELLLMVSNLKELEELKTKYSCNISLSQYSESDKASIAIDLLDELSIEEFPMFVQKFLEGFAKRHGLWNDTILRSYVEKLIQSAGSDWERGETEERIIAIIKNMTSVQLMCNAVLEVATACPVPWSAEIENLVDEAADLDSECRDLIKEQRKLSKLKVILINYNLQNCPMLEPSLVELLIRYILQTDTPSAFDDALKVVKFYNVDHLDVYYWQILNYLETERPQEAMALLDSLANGDKMESIPCLKRIAYFAQGSLDADIACDSPPMTSASGDEDSSSIQMHLMVGLHALRKLSVLLDGPNFEEFRVIQVKFEKVLDLQKEYNWRVLPIDLKSLKLTKLDEEILECIEQKNVLFHVTRLNVLGNHLDFTEEEVMYKLTKMLLNVGKLTEVDNLFESYWNEVRSSSAADLLSLIVPRLVETAVEAEDVEDASLILVANRLIQTAAAICVSYCSLDKIQSVVLITRWKRICQQFFHEDDDSESFQINRKLLKRHKIFPNQYQEFGLPLQASNVLPLVYGFIHSFTKTSSTALTPIDVCAAIDYGAKLYRLLQRKGHNWLALEALNVVRDTLMQDVIGSDESVNEVCSEFLKKSTSDVKLLTDRLLPNVVMRETPDSCLAVCLLDSIPRANAIKCLDDISAKCGTNYQHAKSVSNVALDVGELWNNLELISRFKSFETRAKWGEKLSCMGISFKDASSESAQAERKSVLEEIVSNPDATSELIREYCEEFEFDTIQPLFQFLETLLVNQGSLAVSSSNAIVLQNFEVSFNGGRSLPMLSSSFSAVTTAMTVDRIIKKSESVIDVLSVEFRKSDNQEEDLKLLLHKLKSIMRQINPYSYELITFVLNQCDKLIASNPKLEWSKLSKGLQVIRFLQAYQRVSKPSNYELSSVSEQSILHNLSEIRLPYHPLLSDDYLVIIKQELTFNTVDVWIKVAPVFKLPVDEVRTMTVQLEVERCIKKVQQGVAKLQQLDSVVKDATDLIDQIGSKSVAVACATWVTNNLPVGSAKVEAADVASFLASSWLEAAEKAHANASVNKTMPEENLQKAENAHKKLSVLHQSLVTQHALKEQNLLSPEVSALLQNPKKLIMKLYELYVVTTSSSFIETFSSWTRFDRDSEYDKKDVHGAAEKIAGVHNINLSQIQMNLADRWLSTVHGQGFDGGPSSLDETFVGTPVNLNWENVKRRDDELNLERVVRILSHCAKEERAAFLLQRVLQETPHLSYVVRCRALRCLFLLADPQTLEELSGKSLKKLRQLFTSYHYLSQLEHLQLPPSLKIYDKHEIVQLIRSIWKQHRRDVRVVRLMAELCYENDFDCNTWEAILSDMISLNMTSDLEDVLELLVACSGLWESQVFKKAWKIMLNDAFNRVSESSPSPNQKSLFLSVAEKMFRCPISLDTDFVQSLCHRFNHVGLLAVGIGFLLDMNADKKTKTTALEPYSNKNWIAKICENLSELQDDHFSQKRPVEVFVFDYVRRCSAFEFVEGEYLSIGFTRYLINDEKLEKSHNHNEIGQFLSFLHSAERWTEFDTLTQSFIEAYPSSVRSAELSNCNQRSEMITVFLTN